MHKPGFNPYAAGKKIYGGGRSAPNIGPVGDKQGYKERDLKHKARRDAVLRRLKAGAKKDYLSSNWLGG